MKNMSLRRVGIRSLVWQLDLLWRDGRGDEYVVVSATEL